MRQILVQNSGDFTGTPARPDAVADGKIACFDASDGSGVELSSTAAPDSFFLVQGGDQPIITPIIEGSKIKKAYAKTYVAPVDQQYTISAIPAGKTGGDSYSVKVTNLATDVEPFERANYEVAVPESQADHLTIYDLVDLINDDDKRFVNAGCNKINVITVSGGSGTLGITIDGIDYDEAFDTSADTTADNWVTSHAATVLATHGITATKSGSAEITLTGGVNAGDFEVTDTGATMSISESETEADELYLEARNGNVDPDEQRVVFNVQLNDDAGDELGATINQSVDPVEGSGAYRDIVQSEKDYHGGFGNLYRETPQPLIPSTHAVDGNTYDQYVILVETNNGDSPVKSNQYHEIVIAYEEDVSGDLATFLAAYL